MPVELAIIKQVATWFNAELNNKVRKQQEDWVTTCLAEASQVATAVAVALLSIALNCKPGDDEVQKFLQEVIDDPAAPARIRRLFNEMFTSPSRPRRARLAAVFAGGPRLADNAIERDRLDILAENLLEEDIETLSLLYDLWRRFPARVDKAKDLVFWEGQRGEFYSETHWPVRCTSILEREDSKAYDWSNWPVPSRTSVRSLESAGCLSVIHGHISVGNDSNIYIEFEITELGTFAATKLAHEAIQTAIGLAPPAPG
jgi:hypothetical protein